MISRLTLLGMLVVGAGLLWVAREGRRVWRAEGNVLHPYVGRVEQPVDFAALGLTDIVVPRREEQISAWYALPRTGGMVILCTGTSATRVALLDEARALIAAGHGVLLFDWPGHGESTGTVRLGDSAQTVLRDVIDAVVRLDGVDPRRVGLYAFSYGGVIAAPVAARDSRIRAIVLAGTPVDLVAQGRYEYGRRGWLAAALSRQFWRRRGTPLENMAIHASATALAPRPVLVIAGTNDRVVPPGDARLLTTLIGPSSELWMIEGAEHGHYTEVATDFGQRVGSFFTAALRLPLPQTAGLDHARPIEPRSPLRASPSTGRAR